MSKKSNIPLQKWTLCHNRPIRLFTGSRGNFYFSPPSFDLSIFYQKIFVLTSKKRNFLIKIDRFPARTPEIFQHSASIPFTPHPYHSNQNLHLLVERITKFTSLTHLVSDSGNDLTFNTLRISQLLIQSARKVICFIALTHHRGILPMIYPNHKLITPKGFRDFEGSFGKNIVLGDEVFRSKNSTKFFPTLQLRHQCGLEYGLIEPLLIAEICHPSNDGDLNVRLAGSSQDLILGLALRHNAHAFDTLLQLHILIRHPHVIPTKKHMDAIRDISNYFQEVVIFSDDQHPNSVYPKADSNSKRRYFPMIHLRYQNLSINPLHIVELSYPDGSNVSFRTTGSEDRIQIKLATRREARCFYAYLKLKIKAWNPHTPLNSNEMRDLENLEDYLAEYLRQPDHRSLLKRVRKASKKGHRAELVEDEPVHRI